MEGKSRRHPDRGTGEGGEGGEISRGGVGVEGRDTIVSGMGEKKKRGQIQSIKQKGSGQLGLLGKKKGMS